MDETPFEMVTELNFSQLLKAYLPIEVTDEGIVTESKPEHCVKANSPIVATPSAMVTALNFIQ